MTYFKVICDSTFIGVGTTNDLRKVQEKHNILVFADESDAQYISIDDVLYRANWFTPVTSDKFEYVTATITTIEEEEYESLKATIDEGGEIVVEDDDDTVTEETVVDDLTNVTIEYAKEVKISSMSAACNSAITAGVNVVLSDGETHHFSLTTQDQLNLIALSTQTVDINGVEVVPYHADDELCTWYTMADYALISESATALKLYHTTYFNSLKHYINSLESVADVAAVYYGMAVPEEHQSDILKLLMVETTEDSEDDETSKN